MAASMPSAAMRSTASAAVCTATSSGSRTARGGRRSTCAAPWSALGRLADADAHPEEVLRVQVRRDGAQSVVPRQPAPRLEPHRAGGQVQLVVHDDDVGRVVDPEAPGQRRARPRPNRSCTSSGRRGPRAGRRSWRSPHAPARPSPPAVMRRAAAARSSTASDPALCRLPAYSVPGLPSPTTSRSAGVPRRSDRAKGRRRA